MKEYFKAIDKYYQITSLLEKSLLLAGAILLFDHYDLTKYIPLSIPLYIYILVAAFVVLAILHSRILEAFKIVSINVIDAVSFVWFSSELIIFSVLIFVDLETIFAITYKTVLLIVTFLICVFVIISRIIRYYKSESYQDNIVDLKQIFDNRIPRNVSIFVNEQDVDYDLLGREAIIDRLFNALYHCTPKKTFTISVEGPWGSGKTTLLNIVKNRLRSTTDKSLIIIDEFDPWIYGDQEVMLYHLLDDILAASGVNFSYLTIEKIIKDITSIITGKYPSAGIFFRNNITTDAIDQLKSRINEYLILNNKKIIMFFDNIDRADSKNVILIFKLIADVINFDHTIFVLSFDNKQVERIFEGHLKIDPCYLKKIIQLPIFLPVITKEQSDRIFEPCIKNILFAHNEKPEDYQEFISCICSEIDDLRDFKRLLNAVILPIISVLTNLNKYELLTLELIHFLKPDLYHAIYNNRTFFISHDRRLDMSIWSEALRTKEFNIQGKKFFSVLFAESKYQGFTELLSSLFPYVNNYIQGTDLESEYYKEDINGFNICSAKYFDLYFCLGSNNHLLVGEKVRNLILSLNTSRFFSTQNSFVTDFLIELPYDYHKEAFEVFHKNLNDLSKENYFNVALILWNCLNNIDQTSQFLALSARQRVLVIISKLLRNLINDEFKKWTQNILEDYGKVYAISELIYWLEVDKEENKNTESITLLKNIFKKMCNTIISKPINVYDDKYYSHKNVWGLSKCYQENSEIVTNYIASIISIQNIYRVLYDATSLTFGSKVEYSISSEYFKKLFGSVDVDKILEQRLPQTESEQFVYDIYLKDKYRKDEEDGERRSITMDTFMNISL